MTLGSRLHGAALTAGIGRLVNAIEDRDEAAVEAIIRASRSRRLFAPLAIAVGAFAVVLEGLRPLVSNWRLTLLVLLPAIWIAHDRPHMG